ncbi:hypothetical protein EYR40_005043 [Pleurotus pulmonarius]|nr:hypothetical protein EYR36_006577 [Pleurotus pulmonarius]KAF4601843.1 hypothetical protein EYR40_005043 [Pleurotus pulmonarius]
MHSSIFFLCVLCVTTQAVHDLRAPIDDLSLSASGDGFAELTPLVSNPLRSNSDSDDVDRRDNPLAGDAVYLSLSSNNAWYIVTVGGRTTTFGGFESQVIPSNCSLSFEQAGLPTQSNTIEVLVSGSSLDSSIGDPWSFALDKIVVASTDPAVTSSARAAQSTVTGLSDSSAPPVAFKWATVGLASGAAAVSVFFLF